MDEDDEGKDNFGGKEQEEENNKQPIVTSDLLWENIAHAQKHQPFVSIDVALYIVKSYVSLGSQGTPTGQVQGNKNVDQTVMMAQQLLLILRLSQGMDYVAHEDMDEAIWWVDIVTIFMIL